MANEFSRFVMCARSISQVRYYRNERVRKSFERLNDCRIRELQSGAAIKSFVAQAVGNVATSWENDRVEKLGEK